MRREKSGQVILIAVLAMALMLLSAQVYVVNVQMSTFSFDSDALTDYIAALKQGSRNLVAGSLANISRGGAVSILSVNLDRWKVLVNSQNQFGKSALTYAREESAPYSGGVWLSWGSQGRGVTSSTVDFNFSLSDREVDADLTYTTNVTIGLSVEGTYRITGLIEKEVNVTINLTNEDASALANQIKVYYKALATWQEPTELNNYALTDYGNGTYRASFDILVSLLSVEVSVHAIDGRGILVQTDATCTLV